MSRFRGFSAKREAEGFTLIELLVTISIIAILSAIGLVVFTNVLKQGRDARRQSDLRSIQSALEQYFADQFFYPSLISFGSPLTNKTGNPNNVSSSRTYMSTVPIDPSVSQQYSYIASPSGCDNSGTKCSSYCLYAKLENTNTGLGSCPVNGSNNFALTPP